MARLIALLALVGLVSVQAAPPIKPIPSIPNSYSAMLEMTDMKRYTTFVVYQQRDFVSQRMHMRASHYDQHLFEFNKQSHYFFDNETCLTGNITTEVQQHFHHGNHHDPNKHFNPLNWVPDYDPVTGGMRPANDVFFDVTNQNFSFVGMTWYRGVWCDRFSSKGVVGNGTRGFLYDIDWYFTALNWTQNPFNWERQHNVPFAMESKGVRYFQRNGQQVNEEFHFLKTWHDFLPGRPDYFAEMIPYFRYCAELVQRPIPALPLEFSHVMEHNSWPQNTTFAGKMTYDYTRNTVRFDRWVNGNEETTYVIVSQLQQYVWTHGLDTCTVSQVTDASAPHHHSRWDWLINFQTRHLKPLTEAIGPERDFIPKYYYGGQKPARDIMCDVWFTNFTHNFVHPFQGITSVTGVIAWFFSLPSWTTKGLPGNNIAMPIRFEVHGQTFNMSTQQWDFFTEHREFVDTRIGSVQRSWSGIPPFCPGFEPQHPGETPTESGMGGGAAAGLAFGMLFLGAILAVAGMKYYEKRGSSGRSTANYHLNEDDESRRLSISNSYGAT